MLQLVEMLLSKFWEPTAPLQGGTKETVGKALAIHSLLQKNWKFTCTLRSNSAPGDGYTVVQLTDVLKADGKDLRRQRG